MNNKTAPHIVILTGAGISAESGIKTFRDQDGLWENHPIEDVASPEGFQRDPGLVYSFYNARRAQLNGEEVAHNDGHRALARLIKEHPGEVTLITQNVDDLHERAGVEFGLPIEHVLHMHGELQKMRCKKTEKVFSAPVSFDEATECECCKETGNLRPHIVWFGEIPFFLDEAFEVLSHCDLFISIGTSGHVYPAAQFVAMTPNNCHKIEVNLNDTFISSQFHDHRIGKSSMALPKLVNEILEGAFF